MTSYPSLARAKHPAKYGKLRDAGDAKEDDETKSSSASADAGETSAESQSPLIQDVKLVAGQLLRVVIDSPSAEKPTPEQPTSEKPDTVQSKSTKDQEHPEIKLKKFWQNFEPDYEGGITQILPKSLTSNPPSYGITTKVTGNFLQARETCIKSVKKIIRECRALNLKYTDSHFDLERDLKLTRAQDCLFSLGGDRDSLTIPRDVKRVTDVFTEPQLFKDGAGYDDIIQGGLGDCWLLAGLSAITANEKFLQDICVIHDTEVGVYGFLFYRDGEWQPCIIDDKLYLRAPTFHESPDTVLNMYGMDQEDQEESYKKLFQTGSKALHFGACRDENETWVPLLEKAYAKAHGDYQSLNGGWTGEALEDLTGGVTTEIYTNNILSKDQFWNDRLRCNGKKYLFSAATATYVDWRGISDFEGYWNRETRLKGVIDHHAYAVLDTYEGFGQRLVKMRNPWGQQEWKGAWSDGSKEWTATWLQRLNHQLGDDGVFWISYADMLIRYSCLDCTRLFGPEWYVTQQWTKVQVPWSITDYQQTKFTLDLPAPSEVVIVLSKLDARYFVGFGGQYFYQLHFRLHKDGDDEDDYITRSRFNYELNRSVNVELELEAGKYTVLFKIEAFKTGEDDIETVLRKDTSRRAKITQIATLYDLAHAKGIPAKPEKEEVTPVETKDGLKTDDKTAATEPKAAEDTTKAEATKSEQEGKADDTSKPAGDSKETGQKKNDEKEKDDEKKKDDEKEKDSTKSAEKGESAEKTESAEEDPQRDAWNAFCTVGLRVYSKVPEMQLDVVVPVKEKPATLDRDAIAKSAANSADADSEQKKEGSSSVKEKEEKKKDDEKKEEKKDDEKKEKE